MIKAKPTVTCELLKLEAVDGWPVGTYRAFVHRTSTHPRLGADIEGKISITSRIIRVDFDHRIIETLNTYYHF